MPVFRRARRTSVALAAVSAVMLAAPASGVVTGQWFFSEVGAAGTPVPDGQPFQSGTLPIIYAADTANGGTSTVAATLDATHPKSVYFPGWNAADALGDVPVAESMLSSDPGFETLGGTTDGADGGTAFDPEAATSFKVSAWVLPDDPALVPASVGTGSAVSPNIVQKGVRQAAAARHFWKMSMAMTTSGGVKKWFPFCEFKGESVASPGTIVEAKPGYVSGTRVLMDVGAAYKIECTKTATAVTLTVTKAGGSPVSVPVAVSSFTVSNDRPLSVGHKPGSIDGADVYAGILDNLVIDKS